MRRYTHYPGNVAHFGLGAHVMVKLITSDNTATTVVQRDASGNFSASTITATLSGTATTATKASNLVGGNNGTLYGAMPYQFGVDLTAWVAPNTALVKKFLSMTGSGAGRDPAIGVQRYYWSKNIKTGVAFSNGAHYRNPEVDHLLEAAQVELDPARRRELYAQFQHIVMQDLPYIPLVWYRGYVGASTRVGNLNQELGGVNTNFSHLTLRS